MADISRLKKKRAAQRNVLKGLSVKAKDYMKESFTEETKRDVEVLLKSIVEKEQIIKSLDGEILDLIKEEDIEHPSSSKDYFVM